MDNRLSKIKLLLNKAAVDGILISHIPNITYLTGYCGFTQSERETFLLILKNKQYFITDTRSGREIQKIIKGFETMEFAPPLSLKEALENISEKLRIKSLGIEEEDLTASEFKLIKRYFKTKAVNLNKLREIKDSGEISKIKAACKLTDETFNHILKRIRPGITEKELASEIELFIKKKTADISFPPIVAFGKNSAVPHHISNDSKLAENQIVLLDFGIKLNNYCSDMTRTVFFGKAPEKFKKIYQTVLASQLKAIRQLNSFAQKETAASNIDEISRNYILSQGYPTIPHTLGHGIGLEVHEAPLLSPKSNDTLRENMVFSIEPGIYLLDFGGIRIEDLAVLKKSGPELLTRSPKNLIEL